MRRAVANGKHRDDFLTDILYHEIPTFSPRADELIRQILGLSGTGARQALQDDVERWRRDLPLEIWHRWMSPPWRYLDDMDPVLVASLEGLLTAKLVELRAEGRARGWAID